VRIHEAKKLVKRWLAERVEIDSSAATTSYSAFGDFLEWLKLQSDHGDGVARYQFDSAMKNNDVEQERDGSDWIIRGIKLKGD
jgi:hypothetical protein